MPSREEALGRIVRELEHAASQLHLLVDGLPNELWARRSDPDRWSVAENVAHLNLTSKAYLPLVHEALAEARSLPNGSGRGYRRDAVGWLLSLTVGPLPRLGRRRIGRVRTTAAFVPGADLPRERTMQEFDELQAEQIGLVRSSLGLPIDRVRIASPFAPQLKYNLYSALVVLPRHQMRHVQQAEGVWA